MRFQITSVAVAACVAMSACATSYTMTPEVAAGQEVRYVQGAATTYSNLANGAIQVTPVGVNDQGRMVFSVAAFNGTETAQNFGIENVTAMADGQPVRVFTKAEMERQAKNAATAALVVAALAGATSAYAANQNAYSTSTMTTPTGRVYSYRSYNPLAAQIGSTAATAGTVATAAGIAKTLDGTLIGLGQTVLQTTTIDPDGAYGGQVTTDRVKVPSSGSLDAMLAVQWNGETHMFNWAVTKQQ